MVLNDLTLQPLKQNWASCVKDLLSRLGFLEVWESQGVGNIQTCLNNTADERCFHSRLAL